MPDFPIIDTHVHLWDPNHLRYSWLDETPLLNQSYQLKELDQLKKPVEIDQIVFLEAGADPGQSLAEVNWVTELASLDSRITGIVAQASLEDGEDVRTYLETLAANPLVKGVRRLLQGESDSAYCLRPDFIHGVQILSDYNFSFDICIYHFQLKHILKLVEKCPNTKFILDHIGKPDIKNQLFNPWESEIKALAQFANVTCKISGLVTEADHASWTENDLIPYIKHIIDCFGFDRVMFGGDWPVVRLAAEYPRWVEVVDAAIAGCSDIEKQKLYRSNAIDFYRM
ncbi:MAG: L-fuconolactonase [Cellvibrionaceae bacterium]|jgi:L-fuconolactonase